MKKIVTLALIGMMTIMSYAQSPRYETSIWHSNGQKESLFTNAIDSITFSETGNSSYQQIIWKNGVPFSYAVESIDSVSIKGSIIEYTVIEDPIEDIIGGVVTNEGTYCLLQKNDSIEGYVCYIGENESGEMPMIVKIDTLGIIRNIFCNETFYDFVFHENTFDIIVTSNSETNTIANISYDIFAQTRKSRARKEGGISNGVDGWAEMANKIHAVASIGQIASNPKALSSKIGILTMLGGMSDNKYVRRSAIAVDLVMSLIKGGVLGIVSGLYQAGKEVLTAFWFGDVKLTTLGAEHITDTKYRVRCSVTNFSNISFPGIFTKLTMTLKQNSIISSLVGEMEQDSKYVTNDDVFNFVFDGLELGKQYCFQPRLYRTWYENHSAAKNMSAGTILSNWGAGTGVVAVERQSEYYMYGEIGTFATNSTEIVSIETKEIEATQGHVNFTIEVKGKGYAAPNNDKETLGQGCFGIFIKDGDEYKHFPANSISGHDFTVELSFEESTNTMDELDYTNFIAKKKLEIGSYVMAYRQSGQYDYEKVYYYSEPQEYELVYDVKPSLTFTGARIIETYAWTDNSGYSTNFEVDYNATGVFWAENVYFVALQGSSSLKPWIIASDGQQSKSAWNNYTVNASSLRAFRFEMVMANGSTVSSTNAVQLSGIPVQTISIINNSNARAMTSKRASQLESETSSCFSLEPQQ